MHPYITEGQTRGKAIIGAVISADSATLNNPRVVGNPKAYPAILSHIIYPQAAQFIDQFETKGLADLAQRWDLLQPVLSDTDVFTSSLARINVVPAPTKEQAAQILRDDVLTQMQAKFGQEDLAFATELSTSTNSAVDRFAHLKTIYANTLQQLQQIHDDDTVSHDRKKQLRETSLAQLESAKQSTFTELNRLLENTTDEKLKTLLEDELFNLRMQIVEIHQTSVKTIQGFADNGASTAHDHDEREKLALNFSNLLDSFPPKDTNPASVAIEATQLAQKIRTAKAGQDQKIIAEFKAKFDQRQDIIATILGQLQANTITAAEADRQLREQMDILAKEALTELERQELAKWTAARRILNSHFESSEGVFEKRRYDAAINKYYGSGTTTSGTASIQWGTTPAEPALKREELEKRDTVMFNNGVVARKGTNGTVFEFELSTDPKQRIKKLEELSEIMRDIYGYGPKDTIIIAGAPLQKSYLEKCGLKKDLKHWGELTLGTAASPAWLPIAVVGGLGVVANQLGYALDEGPEHIKRARYEKEYPDEADAVFVAQGLKAPNKLHNNEQHFQSVLMSQRAQTAQNIRSTGVAVTDAEVVPDRSSARKLRR